MKRDTLILHWRRCSASKQWPPIPWSGTRPFGVDSTTSVELRQRILLAWRTNKPRSKNPRGVKWHHQPRIAAAKTHRRLGTPLGEASQNSPTMSDAVIPTSYQSCREPDLREHQCLAASRTYLEGKLALSSIFISTLSNTMTSTYNITHHLQISVWPSHRHNATLHTYKIIGYT